MADDPTGWMDGIEHAPTPNYGYSDIPADGMYPKAIVSHVAQGYMQGLLNINTSANPRASWHFSISRTGRIVQHCSIWNPAWHAGDTYEPTWPLYDGRNPNRATIGIEHEGFSVDPSYGFDYLYSGASPWPEPLIEASLRVHRFIFGSCANWMRPSADTVITHSMLNSATRAQDPGDLWLATVRPRLIRELTGGPPPPPPGVSPQARQAFENVAAWALWAPDNESALAIQQMRGWTDEAERLIGG